MESKCSAFWHHTNIRSDNRIFPCCRFKTPIATFNGNVGEVLFYKEYNSLRESSLAGEHITGCEKCYYEESLGKESLRQQFNKEYDCNDVTLEYLEIGFDNICNLTCDGCWDEFSSAWAKEKHPKEKTMWIKSSTDITAIPDTINKVLFLGGEPLMTNRHYKFLKLITTPSKVEIIYNTNGTFLLDLQTIEKLKDFKRVVFILSIDGYGELNDRVRTGSNWADILKFIEQIKSLGFSLEVNTVIHINNWHGIVKLSEFIKTLDVSWTTNALTYPAELSIKNISNKTNFIELIKNTDIPNKEYLIKHVS
jgi:sulfatase maturation enzyme AslB (radical SAM superfamily)